MQVTQEEARSRSAHAEPTIPPRLMTGDEYRESLRRSSPVVHVNGRRIDCVADEPLLAPGINAIAVTYDVAHRADAAPLALAVEQSTGKTVSRFLHIDRTADDLLAKLELVRLVCQETGCAQRYLAHDALNATWQSTFHIDSDVGGEYHQRFRAWLREVQDQDLAIGVAMTDAKGDRSLHPHEQPNPDAYVHIAERRPDGVVISGTKAIVTGAPYVHEFLVMPCRNMEEADAEFAVCCAVPVDAPGGHDRRATGRSSRGGRRQVQRALRPEHRSGSVRSRVRAVGAGVPGGRMARFPGPDADVRDASPPHLRRCAGRLRRPADWRGRAHVRGERARSLPLPRAARRPGRADQAGRGVLCLRRRGLGVRDARSRGQRHARRRVLERREAPAFDADLRDAPARASRVRRTHRRPAWSRRGPPATSARLADVLRARADIPYDRRIEAARLVEDLTASNQGGWYSVISLHGGGSPDAMKREIMRHYPIGNKVDLVERLLERGVLADPQRSITRNRQPGRCCEEGCKPPDGEAVVQLTPKSLRRC